MPADSESRTAPDTLPDAASLSAKRLVRADAGEELACANAEAHGVRLKPHTPMPPKRQRGRVKGVNDEAFFDPLPDEEIAAFGDHSG